MKARLLVLPLMAAAILSAQPGRGFGGNRPNNGTPPTPPTPAERAARDTQRLTRFLTLDANQQTQVQTILTNQITQIEANSATLKTLRTSLLDAIKANNPGQIDSILLQISPLQEQQAAARAKGAAQIYALLNADQKTKIGNAVEFLGGGGPGGGPGGGGPGGFGRRRGN